MSIKRKSETLKEKIFKVPEYVGVNAFEKKCINDIKDLQNVVKRAVDMLEKQEQIVGDILELLEESLIPEDELQEEAVEDPMEEEDLTDTEEDEEEDSL